MAKEPTGNESGERVKLSDQEADQVLDKFFANPDEEKLNGWRKSYNSKTSKRDDAALRDELKKRLIEGSLIPESLEDIPPRTAAQTRTEMEAAVLSGLQESIQPTPERTKKILPEKVRKSGDVTSFWNAYKKFIEARHGKPGASTDKSKPVPESEFKHAREILTEYYLNELEVRGKDLSPEKWHKYQEYLYMLKNGLTKVPQRGPRDRYSKMARNLLKKENKKSPVAPETSAPTAEQETVVDKSKREYDLIFREISDQLNILHNSHATDRAAFEAAQTKLRELESEVGSRAEAEYKDLKKNLSEALEQYANMEQPPAEQPVVAPEAGQPVPVQENAVVPPVAQEVHVRTPEELQELENRLNEARTKYLRYKKEWQDAQTVKSWFNGQRGRRDEIKTQLDQVEAEYLRARAEYVGIEAEKHIGEMAKLEEKELEILYTPKKAGLLTRIAKGWMALGETSPVVDMKNSGRIKKALFNTRSLISYGLLGAGTVLAGPIGWGAAGGAILMARRGLGGLAAGIGTSELIKSYRQAHLRKDLSEMPSYSEEQYDQVISAMKARGILDGNLKDVMNSDEYKQAIEARKNRIRERFESLAPEQRAERASQMFRDQLELLNSKIATERKWNRGALAAGVGVGLFVGSGKAGEMLKNWLLGETPTGSKPEGYGVANAAESRSGASASFGAETVSSDTVLKVGSRGIEGTLLDLKSSNPSVYQSMIEALRGQDPTFKGDDGGLIHRYAERFAEGNGYNIGEGGGKDLNWIKPGTEITIDGKGMPTISGVNPMEGAPVNVEAPESTVPVEDAGDIETQGAEDTAPTSNPAPAPTPEPMRTGTMNPNEVINNSGVRPVEMSPAPEASSPEPSGPEDTSSDSDSRLNSEREIRNEKLSEAISMNKNSDALKSLMSQDEYKEMLRDFDMNERTLNSLPKDMTYEQFGSKYAGDEDFAKKYMRMMDYLQEARNSGGVEFPRSMSMRTVLALLAESRAK